MNKGMVQHFADMDWKLESTSFAKRKEITMEGMDESRDMWFESHTLIDNYTEQTEFGHEGERRSVIEKRWRGGRKLSNYRMGTENHSFSFRSIYENAIDITPVSNAFQFIIHIRYERDCIFTR